MAVTATDFPAQIRVTENGAPGAAGANGIDGAGFNNVRKSLIDNPLCWLYGKNNIVKVLNQLLTVTRTTSGAYTDIYGQAQVASNDTPREEVKGWLINGDESHQFPILENVPLINGPFSVVFRLGSYSESAASQDIILIDGANGDLLTVGTDGSGNWIATLLGSDLIEYSATTIISATSVSDQAVVVSFDAGDLNIYVNGALAGTVNLPTGQADALDLAGNVTITGNFDLNIQSLRVYDFVLNSNEIEYLD